MDFRAISKFFGGCILPEDYRTDLQRVSRDIEGQSTVDGTPDERKNLLIRAVFHSLTGDLRKATKALNDLETKAEAAKDVDVLIRIPVYRMHLRRVMKSSPPLGFWSDDATEAKLFDYACFNVQYTKELCQKLERIENSVNNHFRNMKLPKIQGLEPRVLLPMWRMVHYTWYASYMKHPACKVRGSGNESRAQFAFFGEYPSSTIHNAKYLDLEETSFLLQLLNMRKQRAGGGGNHELNSQHLEFERENAPTRGALWLLETGDHLLSQPFTSPLALNLMLFASGPTWNDNRGWDRLEPKILCSDEGQAMEKYKASFNLFKEGGCHRGMAAIHLRFGCVSLTKAIDATALRSKSATSNCKELVENAMSEFAKAEILFELDEAHLCVLGTYRLLAQIIRQEEVDISRLISAAQSIGQWGADKDNPRLSRFAGMLFLRAGRRLAMNGADAKVPWQCCVCSQATFSGLGEPLLELRAVEAQAHYYNSIGQSSLAKTHLFWNRCVVLEACNHIVDVIKKTSGDHPERLRDLRNKRLCEFDKISREIFDGDKVLIQWRSFLDSVRRPRLTTPNAARLSAGANASERSLQRLERFVSVRSHDVDIYNQRARQIVNDTRLMWQEHQAAVLGHDSTRAEAVLRVSPDPEQTERNLDSALNHRIQDVVILSFRGCFDEARKILSDSVVLPSHITANFRGSSPGEFGEAPGFLKELAFAEDNMRNNWAKNTLELCYVSRDWKIGAAVLSEIEDRQAGFLAEVEKGADPDRWRTMIAVGYIKRMQSALEQAWDWHVRAFGTVETNRSILADIQDRRVGGALITPIDVFQGLAKLSITLHAERAISTARAQRVFGLPDCEAWRGLIWFDYAVLFFEMGKARVLADMILLHSNIDDVQDWLNLRTHADKIDQLASPRDDPNASRICERSSRIFEGAIRDQELLGLTLSYRGHDSVRGWIAAGNLYATIPEDALVVHVNTDVEQTVILYITSDGVQFEQEAKLTAYDLNETVLQFLDLFRLRKLSRRQSLREKLPTPEQYHPLVAKLSKIILAPASSLLSEKAMIIFVPSKLLHNFPFSALTLDDRPIFVSKTVSVCPSLQAMSLLVQRSRQSESTPERTTPQTFTTFMAPKKRLPTEQPLDVAAAFAIGISHKIQCKAIPAHTLDQEGLIVEMEQSDVVLVSSHGHVGRASPWKTSLSINGPMTVVEMLKRTFQASLIVFQACLSTVSGQDDGNDVIGFSHMVLASGANAFIGATWEVNELAASLLMSFLFDQLKDHGSRISIADALRKAQLKLFGMKRQDVVDELRSIQGHLQRVTASSRFSECDLNLRAIKSALSREIRGFENASHPENPYDHPFFWAPFVLIGHGHQHLSS